MQGEPVKTRYNEKELQEFKDLINEKIRIARKNCFHWHHR